jgi:acyl-homoserine-lactone acylase
MPHRIVFLVILTITAGTLTCNRPTRLPSPELLARDVTIRRDTFGVPHILAATEEAAAYGFGYAQAEDHGAEIVRRMIAARGEQAKYFGESGLEDDFEMVQFDNIGEATRGLDLVSPLYRRILSAYVAGVNTYLTENRRELPDWATAISAADVLANSRAGAVNALAGPALRQQLRNKYSASPSSAPDNAWIDEAPGSNAFALAGSRTTAGKPILLGNPHLNWSSLYWEAHVRVPGRIDFYGSTLVGIPVLRAGFNDRLGFVTTNNAPDLDDVYALEIDPERPEHYRFDGRSMPLLRRQVTVKVRSADGTLREETRTFWNTALGPILYRTPSRLFVVKSSRLEAHRYFEGFYVMSKARSLDEWLAALRLNLVPTSNFTYADADGNILYQWNGQVPIRNDPRADYSLDVPAHSRRDVWSRLHPVDDLPRLLNPPGGYIQNANNPPRFVSMHDPIDMSAFPGYFEQGPLALRPQLALELLASRKTFDVEDVIRAKYETRMLLASRVMPALLDAARAAPADPLARAGAEVLAAWDGRAAADSRGAVLFQRFWDGYARRVRQPFARAWDSADPMRTPMGLADPAAAIEALAGAVRDMRQAHGTETIPWGDVNRFRIGTLDLPGDGATGASGCFRVLRFDPDPAASGSTRVAGNLGSDRPLTGFGDAWVLLVDFAPPVTGWSVLAYGQTTNLSSAHSRDQIGIFADHRLRRAWYTDAEIRANLERAYRPAWPRAGASKN